LLLHRLPAQLTEDIMRKPRNFDAELKALEDKAKELKTRKVRQLGNSSSPRGLTLSPPMNWRGR